jgi:predicted acyl esterase
MEKAPDRDSAPGLLVDKDVEITMRDGVRLRADVFRPNDTSRVPPILNIGSYQKDKHWTPPADLEEADNAYMNWETANPLWWVPHGYATVRIDGRGSGKSPGQTDPWSLQEALDFHDAIEWAARQPWSNGKVGTLGVSYYAITQWLVANLRPPSLKAIIPWEGAADLYRDFAYHGGIFCMGFVASWYNNHMAHHLLGKPQQYNPDTFSKPWLWHYMRDSLDRGAYNGRQADWDRIEVPFYSVGNWSGMGLHLRGNTESFMRSKSPHRKLRIHSGTHFHPFHAEEARLDQKRFLDYWLKDIDNGLKDEPPVKLAIRTGGGQKYQFRFENEWPIARTRWTRMYLRAPADAGNGARGSLTADSAALQQSLSYSATGAPAGAGTASWSQSLVAQAYVSGASFETEPLPEETEVTGPLNLVLWVSSTTEDMDIFATIRNIDADGNDVWEVGQQGQKAPVAKGWLRVSHRKLDSELSLPFRPYHTHDERLPLKPDEVVEVQVEIWPTCMVFAKGHRIRLDIQPVDGVASAPYTHYNADYKTGLNQIHVGGTTPSYLLVPIIPTRSSS